ncbi:unnamed protein product, partial [Ectocarpus fasciculatus]
REDHDLRQGDHPPTHGRPQETKAPLGNADTPGLQRRADTQVQGEQHGLRAGDPPRDEEQGRQAGPLDPLDGALALRGITGGEGRAGPRQRLDRRPRCQRRESGCCRSQGESRGRLRSRQHLRCRRGGAT